MSISKTLKQFPKTFWVANTIELFERWAWYGFYMLFANYLTGSSELGGLEFSQAEKGMIMGIGTGILYFLPVITGAIADRYGYKNVLFLSFIIYTSAFILLPMFNTFTGVFAMYIYLAVGAALFKPVISATIAKTTTDETASIGFGIFYMMVNLGAFIGPLLTLIFKHSSYDLVFYISASVVALNFIMLLFYKEPTTERVSEPLGATFKKIFTNIYTVLNDYKFVLFLLIVAAFWVMYYQLFYTLPVFISQWLDTSSMYQWFAANMPFVSNNYGTAAGQMEAEFITNFDAMYIIIFQILVSSIVMKMKPLHSMMSGFFVCTLGMVLAFLTQDVMFMALAIFIFAIGEMASSPKITEYIGRIAPADKKALYMGYSFIPVFIGSIFAGFVSGNLYQSMSDKDTFVQKMLQEKGIQVAESATKTDMFDTLASHMNMNTIELNKYLWDTYNPSSFWYIIGCLGLFAIIALVLYDRFIMKDSK